MNIRILAFGIAREIFGSSQIELSVNDKASIADLKKELEKKFPRLGQLASYMVAQNSNYAENGSPVQQQDEIAIIPPVSGG